jgi:hypothetical protein
MAGVRVDRGYLFWGIFFVLLGLIPLADREGWIDIGGFGDAWRLWPLLLVAIGVVILLSRSRLALVATVVLALVLGTIAGTALASFGGGIDCGATSGARLEHTTSNGTLSAPASVDVHLDCGTLTVEAGGTGSDWTLDAGHVGGAPRVETGPSSLAIRPADGGPRRQEWRLTLPAQPLDSVQVEANAASATVDLGTARLTDLKTTLNAGDMRLTVPTGGVGRLESEVNAGDMVLVAPAGDIANLDLGANAGRLRVTLGGSVTGTIKVTAATADVCVPADAQLRIQTGDDFAFSTDLGDSGLTRSGDVWVRSGTGPMIDLEVHGTAGSFALDPAGGCE